MPAPPRPAAAKRPYLAREARRLALLDVAAGLVEAQGWGALSMLSLAEAAQVSRQLVYQHFVSVDDLLAQTMTHLFRHPYEAIRREVSDSALDIGQLVAVAERITFDEPPARVRALWQMLTAAEGDNPAAAKVSTRVRHLLIKLWTEPVMRHAGLPEAEARTAAWMILMAFWGAHQMVAEGAATRMMAVGLCQTLVAGLRAATAGGA